MSNGFSDVLRSISLTTRIGSSRYKKEAESVTDIRPCSTVN